MSLETYLLYLGALGVFFATPPDTSQFLIMSNSVRHGLRASLATVAGDLSANVLQMSAAAFGLATIIAVSAEALIMVKWLGVGYLFWLGVALLQAKPGPRGVATAVAARPAAHFRQGFLTSAANPYAVLFFGALFPQFIDPGRPVLPQLLVLGATYLLVDGALLLAWGWAARGVADRLGAFGGRLANRISGGLMIAAAALLAGKDLGSLRDGAR
jgi:threonine/homoserine/homoserine lactone efflux protein